MIFAFNSIQLTGTHKVLRPKKKLASGRLSAEQLAKLKM